MLKTAFPAQADRSDPKMIVVSDKSKYLNGEYIFMMFVFRAMYWSSC